MTPPVDLVDQADERHEVINPEAGPAGSEDEERVRALNIGPGGRHRAHLLLTGLAEEDPVLTPRMGIPDELELLAEQRVEWVGHTESRRTLPTTCS